MPRVPKNHVLYVWKVSKVGLGQNFRHLKMELQYYSLLFTSQLTLVMLVLHRGLRSFDHHPNKTSEAFLLCLPSSSEENSRFGGPKIKREHNK